MTYFPQEVLENIFSYITSHQDRNTLSLVCKSWFKVERLCRHRVFIGNCYALTPERLIARFPRVRDLILKGKPHFADFNLVPQDWGGFVYPWIEALAKSCPRLEKIKLKRMVVSDKSLELLSHSFPNFKSLVLVGCEGFSTDGLAAIAANCRLLEVLDLQENEVEEVGQWLNCFPESCTSLVSLNFAGLTGQVDLAALETLVARCPNLRSLRLNRAVPLDMLQKILVRAPQLVDLGIGSYVQETNSEPYIRLCNAVLNCKSVLNLSGFWEVAPSCLPAIYPVCWNLTSLNLSFAPGIWGPQFDRLIRQCQKIQRLWVLDFIGDKGLEVVACTCKDLQELRVFPSDPYNAMNAFVTEEGLVAISVGCPKLHSLLYFCRKMTNAALITVAKNCPNFTHFRLYILNPKKPDHVTLQPLDEGFGAIVQSCKELRRLSLSGLLTDQVFLYVGMYAERLEMLSVAFAGGGDKGMLYVLNGCRNLRKLEIRDSPFGDAALLAVAGKYETMRFLGLSFCEVTLGGCKALAKKVPMLNIEIINEKDQMEENPDDSLKVEKMYLYRTLDGPRNDAPDFVWTI